MLRLTCFGIPTEVHLSFFVFLVVLAATGNGIFAGITVIFSFLHELAHGKVAERLGYRPEKITAGFFGGVLHLRETSVKPVHELLIHLSGPFLNLVLAGGFYMAATLWPSPYLDPVSYTHLDVYKRQPEQPIHQGFLCIPPFPWYRIRPRPYKGPP